VNFLWFVSQKVLLAICWKIFRVSGVPLVLAVFPEEMADNNCKSKPNHKDLGHQPEINFGGRGHTIVPLSLKINELHK
jgi:hypothetical protein